MRPALSYHLLGRSSELMIRKFAAIAVTLLGSMVVPGAQSDPPIDTPLVKKLLAAPTIGALDALYRECPPIDAAYRAIYRQRRLTLSRTRSEELRFLETMPSTEEELSRIYQLTDPSEILEDPGIIEVVYEMFGTAAELVHKHGKFHKEFIYLVYMTDGEIGEIAWPEYDGLLNLDPRKTLEALQKLPVEIGRTFCRGIDPKVLSLPEAQQKCHSELG